MTTEAVINEITNPLQMEIVKRHTDSGDMLTDTFGNDDFILEIYSANAGLSLTDCSVIELAKRTQGILLSSDKSLRTVSQQNNIEVHGVVWVIQKLMDSGIISVNNGCDKLVEYIRINPRAPKLKINELIESLK